ncbi:hypothetical protein PGB90_009297 [Kerria lacca]
MDLEDSFAERMRNRALQRMQRNAHIMKTSNDSEPVFKKPNIDDNSFDIGKPKIAEHLTVRKNSLIDKVELDEPEVFMIETCTKKDLKKKPTDSSIRTKTSKKRILDQSVIKTLESQGYIRTVSDAHLFYDFKTGKKITDKENINDKMIPEPVKKKNEISNLYSNSKYQSNVFIQNSIKMKEVENQSNISTDPCFRSVAERRKLFEKKLVDATAEATVSNYVCPENNKIIDTTNKHVEITSENVHDSGNEYSTCESDGSSFCPSTDHESECNSEAIISDESNLSHVNDEHNSLTESSHLHQSDKVMLVFHCLTNIALQIIIKLLYLGETDVSEYPVLQTMKQVKFASTPKPGRLYPSISDLDGEVDEENNISTYNNDKEDNDDSFGREILIATNSIYSSFQNSRKDISEGNDKSKSNILSDVKDLLTSDNASLSPSLHIRSTECSNETASFTFMKKYSNSFSELSPISISDYKNPVLQVDVCNEEKSDAETEFKLNEENKEMNVKQKIKFLEEQIIKEKIKLTQAIRALKLCLSTSFLNSVSHLEAEKLVMLLQIRIMTAQNEIDRIKVENSVESNFATKNSVRGNVEISKIKLPIKLSIVHADLKENIYNNLMCVIKCGEMVWATEVISVTQNNIKYDPECKYIEFSDIITVPNVCSDFTATIEVYNLLVEKKDNVITKQSQAMKKDKKISNLSKKSKKNKELLNYVDDKINYHSSFKMVGYMIFSHNEVHRHQWILNKNDLYHTPLVGMLLMQLKCNLIRITVQQHGFLTMYEMISGYGAWCRYWFYLNGDKLSYWKYPEQEFTQEPIGSFDLARCITEEIVVVGYDVVFRPQTFILQFSPSTYLLQFKGLTENRLLLSADNEEERITWCDHLNEVLKSVRSWSNYENQSLKNSS